VESWYFLFDQLLSILNQFPPVCSASCCQFNSMGFYVRSFTHCLQIQNIYVTDFVSKSTFVCYFAEE